jgi:predicted benzoate:H+ symporter BenE
MPFEVAITVVILNGFLYLWHAHLGDPVVPGWITPAIPLVLLWLKTFPEGVPRMHALIAFEFELGLLSLILGSTGLAKRFVNLIPDALKAGILLGAGIAAVRLVFQEGGRFDMYPWTITIAIGFAFYVLFSNHFKILRSKYRVFRYLANLGLMPALLLAIIIAPLLGELPWPDVKWGFTIPWSYPVFVDS